MALTMASNLLNKEYNDELEILHDRAKKEAESQTSDSKAFSQGLIEDLETITDKILKRLT